MHSAGPNRDHSNAAADGAAGAAPGAPATATLIANGFGLADVIDGRLASAGRGGECLSLYASALLLVLIND